MNQREKSRKELLAEIRTLKSLIKRQKADKQSTTDRYNYVFEELPDAVVLLDAKGIILDVNKAFCKLIGFKKPDLVSYKFKELLSYETQKKFTLPKTFTKGKLLTRKVLLFSGKNVEIEAEINIKKSGKSDLLVTVEQVSEFRKIQRQLAENQIKTKILLNKIPAVIWTTDKNLLLSSFTIKGKSKSGISGKTLSSIFPGKTKSYAPVAAHYKALKGETAKIIHTEKDRIFESVLEPIREGTSVVGVLGCSFDITDKAKQKNNLRESEEHFRMIVENSEDVVFKIVYSSAAYKYEFISPSVKTLTGYSSKDYYKDPHLGYKIIHDEDKPHAMVPPKGKPGTCISKKVVNRLVKKSGEICYVETINNFFFDDRNKVKAIIGVTRNITERKNTETSLADSEMRFRKMAEATLEGIVIHENGIISDVNNAFCNMLGYSYKELVGTSAIDLVTNEYKQVLIDAIQSGKSEAYEVVGITKDGKEFIAELSPRELLFKGRKVRIVAVRDISLRKAHEAALAESEQQYRFLFEKNPLPMWLYDSEDLSIVHVNEAAVEKYGYSKEEFKKLTLKDVRPNEEDNRFDEYYKKYRNKDSLYYRGQWVHKKKDGTLFEVEVTKGTFKNAGKSHHLVIIKDVSETIFQQKKVFESEERFRMLAENAVDVVYRFQVFPESKYEYVSPSVFHLTGYKPEDFYGDPYLGFKLVHPDDRHLVNTSQNILQEGKSVNRLKNNTTILRWLKKSGEVIWTETKNKPIYDENGLVKHIEGISRNITERITLEHELIESRETYKSLLESIPAGVLIINGTKIIYANPSAFSIFGFSDPNQNLDEISIFDHILPEFHTKIAVANQRVLLGEKFPFLEIKAKRVDGQIIDLETRSVLVKFKGTDCIQAIFYDITYRKRIERSIKESEERFKVLSKVSLEGIVFTNSYKKVVDCNDRFLEMFNYKDRSDVIGLSFCDALGCESDRSRIVLSHSDEVHEFEVSVNGVSLFAEFKSSGIPNNEQLITATVIKNITQRKVYETEIDTSRKTYKELIESSPDAILIYRNDKVIYVNPEAKRIFEVDDEKEIIGLSVRALVPPDLESFIWKRKRAAEEGIIIDFVEITIPSFKGNLRNLETKSIKVNYQGESAIMVVIHDLSERKELIREKLRAHVAEEANLKLQEEIERHQRTQYKLQLNQQYTRSIIESSVDMIIAADINENITEFNKAAQNTFGYTFEEMKGKPFAVLYADKNEKNRITNEINETGQFKGEVLNRKKNGEIFLSYLTASAHISNEGQHIGYVGVSRDITKIKLAEEALRLSEEKYRAIYNQVFVGIAMVSLDGYFMQVNKQLCKMLGYTEEEMTKKNYLEIVDPADIPLSIMVKEELMKEGGQNFTIEKKYRNRNNDVVYAILTSTLVKNEKGEPDYYLSVFQDVTSQRRVEEQVRLQASKINSIFECSTHLIWTLDRNFCLTSYNQNYNRLIREFYNVDCFIGMSINTGSLVSSEEYNNFWNKKISDALEGYPQHFETSFVDRRSGKVLWLEMYINPIFDANNEVVEVSGIGHDITEKKTAEDKIRSSLREKEVLLKEVHHRVKNNLQVISSILNLQSSYVKDKNTLDMLRESQDRIKSMSFIHESLYAAKDFSKINFGEYITNLSKNLLHSYRIYGNHVSLDIKADTVFMNLDYAIPSGLIINELISNAFKYAFPNDRSGRVSIKMTESGNTIFLIIEDNGVGLPANIDYRNTESLGLQLVCTLVDQLNGQISLDNENGTKFTIWFNKDQKII